MPRLVYSNEKFGCGATIELDNEDVCMISVAQAGVLVRLYRNGFFTAVFGSVFGPTLYNEKNVYLAAKTAASLGNTFPEKIPAFEISESSSERVRQCRLALLPYGGHLGSAASAQANMPPVCSHVRVM